MNQLIVRNLEPSLVLALKRRASAQGNSAEEVHRRLLAKALGWEEEGFPDLKGLLLAMPGADFELERTREHPRDLDLS